MLLLTYVFQALLLLHNVFKALLLLHMSSKLCCSSYMSSNICCPFSMCFYSSSPIFSRRQELFQQGCRVLRREVVWSALRDFVRWLLAQTASQS